MRKKILLAMICLASMFSGVSAQNTTETEVKKDTVTTAFTDSLNHLKAAFYAHFRVWEDLEIPVPRVRPNPDFYKLFVPPTYYHSVIDQAFGIDWEPGQK